MSDEVMTGIVELKRDEVLEAIQRRIGAGDDPLRLLEECREGMVKVGQRFEKGEYFLSELLLSAEIFKAAAAILEPHLAKARPSRPLGKVVLATLRGDIHDLGKNIVAVLLRAQGFDVYDLGVDVPPHTLVEKVREIQPDIVGFSALVTPAFASMKEAADGLKAAGLRDRLKLIIGGAVTDSSTKEYVGADFQTTDAVAGVNYCLNVVGGK